MREAVQELGVEAAVKAVHSDRVRRRARTTT
jgi:hypothetical protein